MPVKGGHLPITMGKSTLRPRIKMGPTCSEVCMMYVLDYCQLSLDYCNEPLPTSCPPHDARKNKAFS